MENISRVVVSFVYYASLIRDTLEYTITRDGGYDLNFYRYKQNGIINELKLNTPLKNFIDNNGEPGQKLKERLETFGNEFYGENSTVIKVANEGLRVDHGQNSKIFELSIPAYRELNNIVNIHVNYAREHQAELKVPAEELEKLVSLRASANRYFTAVAFLTLSREIFTQFDEFQKLKREANGADTPQSNFIQGDLNKLAGLLELVKRDSISNDAVYTDASDALFHAVEIMSARRQVPTGKTFADCVNEANTKISALIRDSEENYKTIYGPLLTELIEDSKKLREQQEAGADPTKA